MLVCEGARGADVEVGVDVVVAAVFEVAPVVVGSVVALVAGSGLRRRLPEPSTAFSRAGFSDAFVSRVEICMVPVDVRFGPRSSVSPVFAGRAPGVVDALVVEEAPSFLAVDVAAAVAASFFLASALVSPRRRPAALGARLS